MPLQQGNPQTPEINQAQFAASPERSSGGIGLRTKAGLMIGGVLSMAAILAPGAASAEEGPAVDTEKAALAAFGNNAITRSVDSFAALSSTEAQESAKRGMKPEAVIKSINRIVGLSHGNGGPLFKRKYGMDIRSATITATTSSFKGKCNPKNKYDPGTKRAKIKNGKESVVYCFGVKSKSNLPILTEYSPGMNRLGTKVATSAGLSAETHGSTSRISATRNKATVKFTQDNAGATDKQLRSLILRKGKPPVKRWYE